MTAKCYIGKGYVSDHVFKADDTGSFYKDIDKEIYRTQMTFHSVDENNIGI